MISDSVTNIGEWAFNGCTSLESITLSDSITSIGKHAFLRTALSDVYYYGTEEQWNQITFIYSATGAPGHEEIKRAKKHFIKNDNKITEITADNWTEGLALVQFKAENLPLDASAYIAAYKDNRFLQLKRIAVKEGINRTFFEIDDENLIKIFIWDSLESMTPLCTCGEERIMEY